MVGRFSDSDEADAAAFRQPFLALRVFRADGQGEILYFDVDSELHRYFHPESHEPLPLFRQLCDYLAEQGMRVVSYHGYFGSVTATHIIRKGMIYSRLEESTASTKKKAAALAEARSKPPEYRGVWVVKH